MARLLLVLAGALTALLLLPSLPAQAIVGGQVATRDYPHVAAVEFRQDDGDWVFICGASLVRPDVVLTAAHCVQGEQEPGRYRFLLGTRDRSRGGERIEAVTLVDHPQYDPESAAYDVALLRLARASTLGAPIRIAGAGDADRFEPGDEATIAGWGATSSGGDPTTELREGEVPVVSDSTCARGYTVTASFDPKTMICAGNTTGGEDTCQGDSGGPLMVPDAAGRLILVADVSFGFGCAFPTQYGVYGEVAGGELRPWVEARIAELSPGSAAPASPPPSPEPAGEPARARVRLPARLRRARRMRVLVRTDRPLRGLRVTLVRPGGRVVAVGRRVALRSRNRVVLRARRGLRAGRATLRLTARDDLGRRVRVQRRASVRGTAPVSPQRQSRGPDDDRG